MKFPIIVSDMGKAGYAAEFIDMPGCLTSGNDFEHLWEGLQDAVEVWMDGEDDAQFPARASTPAEAYAHPEAKNGVVMFVDIDTSFMDKRAVKISITVPAYALAAIDKAVAKSSIKKDNRSKFMTRAALELAERMERED